jgi:arginase
LIEGAHRSAALVPADVRVTVPVMNAAGPVEGGVRALGVLVENLLRVQDVLRELDDLVITVGGDCGVDLAPITAAHDRYGDRLTLLWIDAHPDLYSPRTIRSFHGMVLRTLLGDGPHVLVPPRPLSPAQVILGGVRTGDPTEFEFIDRHGLRCHGVADLARAFDGLTGPVYAHVDLDVLDPDSFAATCYPVADGVATDRLAALLSTVDNLVGAAITEHAPFRGPVNKSEADVIRRLGAALCR